MVDILTGRSACSTVKMLPGIQFKEKTLNTAAGIPVTVLPGKPPHYTYYRIAYINKANKYTSPAADNMCTAAVAKPLWFKIQ